VVSDFLSLLPESPTQLVAFRWSTYDVPFWARGNSRPGRWHRADGDSTQYWSLTPEAAWAELIRQEGLTAEAELDLLKMPLWVCRVSSALILDLRQVYEQEEHGITEEELIDDDWSACQRLGARLRTQKPGVIAPCAALPSHANLTLFGPRRAVAWTKTPALASVIPATMASVGRPPPGLIDRVRRRTSPPAGDRLF
jgi:RES domain-containing protein